MPLPAKFQIAKHRAARRRSGLRLVRIRVLDTRRPGFAEECRRQSLALRDEPAEAEMSRWWERVADTGGWTR